MSANLPETLDGLVLNTADQAEHLLASLRHLEQYLDHHFQDSAGRFRRGAAFGHRREDEETTADVPRSDARTIDPSRHGESPRRIPQHTREDVDHMVQCVWRAIGLVEGACQSLESAKQLRARCQDEE